MRNDLISESQIDAIWTIDVSHVISFLGNNPKKETVDQLYDFGKLLLDQARTLRSSYDSKLTSCLGWSSALLAFVLIGGGGKTPTLAGAAIIAGAVAALASLFSAAFGLASRAGWKFPSEKDWFAEEYLAWPQQLKIHHIIAMLEAHQSYNRHVQKKGYALMVAEWSLAVSGTFLGAVVIFEAAIRLGV